MTEEEQRQALMSVMDGYEEMQKQIHSGMERIERENRNHMIFMIGVVSISVVLFSVLFAMLTRYVLAGVNLTIVGGGGTTTLLLIFMIFFCLGRISNE